MFGRHLKLFRVRAGLERAEFGTVTGYATSPIASFEQGRRVPQPEFIDQADELLHAGGVLKAGSPVGLWFPMFHIGRRTRFTWVSVCSAGIRAFHSAHPRARTRAVLPTAKAGPTGLDHHYGLVS